MVDLFEVGTVVFVICSNSTKKYQFGTIIETFEEGHKWYLVEFANNDIRSFLKRDLKLILPNYKRFL